MARKKTSQEKEYNILLSNMRDNLKTTAGREVIWHLLSMCNLYTPSFSSTERATDYMEGKRAIGLELLKLLEDTDPTAYPRLVLEKQDVGVEYDNRDNRNTSSADGAHIDSDTGAARG